MNSTNGYIPCLAELTAAQKPGRGHAFHASPACDFAEGRIWETLGAGQLIDPFKRCGLDVGSGVGSSSRLILVSIIFIFGGEADSAVAQILLDGRVKSGKFSENLWDSAK